MRRAPDGDTIVILRCGDTVPAVAERRGEFSTWIAAAMREVWEGEIVELDVRASAPGPELLDAAALVLTGSSSSVTERAPWMLATEARMADAVAADRPVLGICFGHQLLAQALGGEVAKNPRGREIGTITVETVRGDPLLDRLGPSFVVNATHVDTVASLPAGATVLARSELEPTAVFAVNRARGVQFHPEIDGDVMRGYLDARRPVLTSEGFDVDAMIARAGDTPAGTAILKDFVTRFVKRLVRRQRAAHFAAGAMTVRVSAAATTSSSDHGSGCVWFFRQSSASSRKCLLSAIHTFPPGSALSTFRPCGSRFATMRCVGPLS